MSYEGLLPRAILVRFQWMFKPFRPLFVPIPATRDPGSATPMIIAGKGSTYDATQTRELSHRTDCCSNALR